MPTPDGHDELTTAFLDFARTQTKVSPLYAGLAREVARHPAVLALYAGVPERQRLPVLVFAAVHLTVLEDGTPFPATPEAFVGHCRRHHDRLAAIMATRRVQTNEVGRLAALRAGLTALPTDRPIRLVELGASAGLLLVVDRVGVRYEPWGLAGAGPVLATCDASRARPPMGPIPPIADRQGLDLHPVDVRDDEQLRWLEACVWADDRDRLARLAAAVELARRDPPPVARQDLRTWTPPPGDDVVVWHSWVAAYLTEDEQRALAARCAGVTWIFAESRGRCPDSRCRPVATRSRRSCCGGPAQHRSGWPTCTRTAAGCTGSGLRPTEPATTAARPVRHRPGSERTRPDTHVHPGQAQRQVTSVARVIPIRGVTSGSAGGPTPSSRRRTGARSSSRSTPSKDRSMPSARVSRAGPRHSSRSVRARGRARRISSTPSTGASARISTA